jgi:hypothetical protein
VKLDPEHCGACGNACLEGQLCSRGVCGNECSGGTLQCGDLCVDTQVDPQNCGDCGIACAAGELCSAGSCALQCGGGTTLCAGGCVDTMIDANHCGECDNPCPGSACVAGMCGDAPSCNRLHASDPSLPTGLYAIDPDGPGGDPPFQVLCDMETDGGGWMRLANIAETNVALSANTYLAGLGTIDDVNYVHACTKFTGLGEESVARVTMGMVVDFFQPSAGNDMCAMLQTSQKHLWSATVTGGFVPPVYHPTVTLLGGSLGGWPTDGRAHLSFWGGNGATSGCCHTTYGGTAAWNRAFVLDVREP